MIKNKKSEAGLAVVLSIIVVLFFFGWLINLSQRECKSNKDCNSESYCGSDFSCHSYPNIQKTVVQYNFLFPSIIIGIAIVAASLIFRWNKRQDAKIDAQEASASTISENTKPPVEVEDIKEPYYKSDNNAKGMDMKVP